MHQLKEQKGRKTENHIDLSRNKSLEPSSLGWDAVSGVSAIVGVVGLILGGVWGAIQYNENRILNRSQETLKMIEQFENKGVRSHYISLAKSVSEIQTKIPQDEIEMALQNEEFKRKLATGISARVLDSDENLLSLHEVVYYFTKLELCLEANLCSIDVARVYFGDTVSSFLAIFDTQLKRSDNPFGGFGQELRKLDARFSQTD